MTGISDLWAAGADDAPFWAYCRQRELRFQTCADCGEARHPPHPVCPHCGSLAHDYRPAPQAASLYSFTIVRTVAHPAFADEVPYCIGIVLFDGLPLIKLVSGVQVHDSEILRIGMRLQLEWVEETPDLMLPFFTAES